MYSLSWSIVLGLDVSTLLTSMWLWKVFFLAHFELKFQATHILSLLSAECMCVCVKCLKVRDRVCVVPEPPLLVKSVGKKLQAVNTWSATWVSLFISKSLIFRGLFYLFLNVPSLLNADSGMFRQQLGLLGDWVLTFDSISWLKCSWMWSDFCWSHFNFDVC